MLELLEEMPNGVPSHKVRLVHGDLANIGMLFYYSCKINVQPVSKLRVCQYSNRDFMNHRNLKSLAILLGFIVFSMTGKSWKLFVSDFFAGPGKSWKSVSKLYI